MALSEQEFSRQILPALCRPDLNLPLSGRLILLLGGLDTDLALEHLIVKPIGMTAAFFPSLCAIRYNPHYLSPRPYRTLPIC